MLMKQERTKDWVFIMTFQRSSCGGYIIREVFHGFAKSVLQRTTRALQGIGWNTNRTCLIWLVPTLKTFLNVS